MNTVLAALVTAGICALAVLVYLMLAEEIREDHERKRDRREWRRLHDACFDEDGWE